MIEIRGECKWCNKDITMTEAFVSIKDNEYSCIKCYKNSGHMLPFWEKNNRFKDERHKTIRTTHKENRIQNKRNDVV